MELIEILLDYGLDVNARNDLNQTALMFAAEGGQDEAFFTLLRHGAEPDYQINGKYDKMLKWHKGWTALMFAYTRNDYVVALLDQGADPNIKNAHGLTALYYALHNMAYPTSVGPYTSTYQPDVVSTLCAWPTVLDKTGCPQ